MGRIDPGVAVELVDEFVRRVPLIGRLLLRRLW